MFIDLFNLCDPEVNGNTPILFLNRHDVAQVVILPVHEVRVGVGFAVGFGVAVGLAVSFGVAVGFAVGFGVGAGVAFAISTLRLTALSIESSTLDFR